MDLIIIACSKTKRSGGYDSYHPSPLRNYLSNTQFNKLLNARRELATLLGMSPGPDLGYETNVENVYYSPAYRRYSGIMYSRNNLNDVYTKLVSIKIIIMSGLYGVLDASEDIRKYNLNMSEKLPSGQRIYSWWKDNNLGEIVDDIVNNEKFSKTHELLSYPYRNALFPWPRTRSRQTIDLYNPPKSSPGNPGKPLKSRANYLRKLISD